MLKKEFLPVMDNVGDNGSKQAQQHNCSTCINHRVQKLPWVLGERQHCLKILWKEQNDLTLLGMCETETSFQYVLSFLAVPFQGQEKKKINF